MVLGLVVVGLVWLWSLGLTAEKVVKFVEGGGVARHHWSYGRVAENINVNLGKGQVAVNGVVEGKEWGLWAGAHANGSGFGVSLGTYNPRDLIGYRR